MKRFTSWLHSWQEFRNLKDMDIETIDQLIGFWLVDVKKDSGDNYEPGTLNSYLSSLCGHLRDLGHDISKLEVVKRVSKAKAKDLKSQGKGNTPNRAGCLTATEENKLWESGALGKGDPESLLHALWYLFTKGFGFRGSHESRQLQFEDVQLKHDGEGRAFLEWNERLTKTRNGSSAHQRAFPTRLYENDKDRDRCPVTLYWLHVESDQKIWWKAKMHSSWESITKGLMMVSGTLTIQWVRTGSVKSCRELPGVLVSIWSTNVWRIIQRAGQCAVNCTNVILPQTW